MNIARGLNRQAAILAVSCVLFLLSAVPALAQPAPPPDPILDMISFFRPNWESDGGYPPVAFTNLVSVSNCWGNALLLDTTNLAPSFLVYNIVEANTHTNLDLSAGAVTFLATPDWASADTNQNGQGPGAVGFLLAAGDWSSGSPQGLWAIYVDPGGTNIYFGGVSNSASTTYVSAPISWASNSIHMIEVYYWTNSTLYLDGQLVAAGGPVTIVPSTNVWTNGFNIGSDNAGYEQFRGIFQYVEMDITNILTDFGTNYFTDWWEPVTNEYYTWLESSGGGGGMFSPGSLNPIGSSSNCIYSNAVYLTNMSVSNVPGYGVTFTFTIQGGASGVVYDLLSTTNLVGPAGTNIVWAWLGQGINCGIYQVTNQPAVASYYMLGWPGNSSDGYGTPNEWYWFEGLDPLTAGLGGADLNGDGLPNWQKYLYGANPTNAAPFAIWVSQPGGTTGLP